ncbi:MAG: DMT family transporter, partial [Pseudomonadota bacterium]|nr:DMT family transporter [Pseudomonadota bacterium]
LSLAASAAMAAMVLGLARIPPGRAALLFNLEPVLSILLAAAFLGEVLTPTHYLGGLLAIGAVALGGRPSREGGKKQDE